MGSVLIPPFADSAKKEISSNQRPKRPNRGFSILSNWIKTTLVQNFGPKKGENGEPGMTSCASIARLESENLVEDLVSFPILILQFLDLGCGKGSDAHEFSVAGTQSYVGVGESRSEGNKHPWCLSVL